MTSRQPISLYRLASRPLVRAFVDKARALTGEKRGVAAIEFAFFAIFMSLGLANVFDVSVYIYQTMEAQNATQVAAQAAWKTCDLNHLPATTNCSGLTTAITNALKSTSLGTSVTLVSGSPSEGYYCVNSSNALQYVSGVSSKPADCTAAGMPALQPGDYIQVQTTFAYAPMFANLSIASTFTTPISSKALLRLG